MIYFDNAATSFPKPECVIRELNFCLKKCCGNPGRSSHSLSTRASEKIYEAREAVAEHLGIKEAERVVFTYNATYALNLAIKAFITKKCHVIVSDVEHNSVIRPLEKLREKLGIEYSLFDSSDITASLTSLIRSDTVGIISTIASNVTGKDISIKTLSDIAKKHDLFLILDASQAMGHSDINLENTPCDVLCAPGHKGLFGIQGSGIAVFRSLERKDSFIEGGSGTNSKSLVMPMTLPEAYEAGTPATPAIATLYSGIKFIDNIGVKNISARLSEYTDMLYERMITIDGISIYPHANGIISFNYKSYPSNEVAMALDKLGVCTRAGLHCAPAAHKKLCTEKNNGCVRLSLSYLNKKRDIDDYYKIIKNLFA